MHAYLVIFVGIALIRYFLIGLCTHICHTVYLVIVSFGYLFYACELVYEKIYFYATIC